MDKANYLVMLSQLQRVSSTLPGEQENFLARTLHPTHYGRFCPTETPEGTEVGLRKSYASTTERNLEDELVVFSIPQTYIGEGIKVGSVILLDDDTNITLTDDSYSNLIDSGSNIRGNIFYDRGLVVVTKDITSGSNFNTFRLDYRSTKTIYENEMP
jgi:DNA-directed RNA polymerase beta subunit